MKNINDEKLKKYVQINAASYVLLLIFTLVIGFILALTNILAN